MFLRILLSWGVALLLYLPALAQTNVITDPGFESITAGTSSYTTNLAGTVSGAAVFGRWQLTFVTGTCSTTMPCSGTATGCSSGSSVITTADRNSGNQSIYIRINKQTNRNDIKLYQVLSQSVAAGSYEVSFYMKSDGVSLVTVNVFKSTAAATANGGETSGTITGTASSFSSTTGWRKYRAVVDLSGWTEAERTGLRVSFRPNTGTGTTGTSLPQGPCPKQFWFDDFVMRPASTRGDLVDLRATAIQVARERQALAANAGFTDEANDLLAEINSLTATPTPLVPDKAIGFFPAPLHTTAATNPFIQSMNSWAGTYLGQSFPVYTKSTSTSMVFPGGRGLAPTIRETGATAESLYWLLVSPLSDYQYNPDLFYRFLHILYASADDYNIHGASGEIDEVPGATTSGLNDWFAAPMFAYSWRMGDYSFADYIPTTFKNRLRNASEIMGGIYFTIAQTGLAGGTYVNRDVSYAEVLAHTGLHRNRTDWTDYARTIVTSLNTRCIYPDGAYSYIRDQNETANYHGGTNNSLAKIHAVLDVPEALTAIAKTVNYELLSIEPAEVPEFFTAPSWKTQWNGQSGFSGEPLLFLTGNPYLKGQFDTFKNLFGTGYNPMYRKILPSSLNVSFYRNDITAKPLPNNYVVYDRNIQGARARYGRFSYAINGRDVDANETVGSTTPGGLPGMQTFVGAMVTQAGRQTFNGVNRDEYNAALMAVHSKVHVRTTANQEWRDWVYTSTRINPKTNVTKTATAFSSPANLQRQNVGPTTFDSDWGTFQQWITLPDRLIGVVETFPKNGNPAQALEIDGRVRFTYGRAELTNPKNITVLEANKRYAYGNLQAIIHDHDFTQISTGTAGILRDDFPTAEEIVFRYNLSDGTTPYTYPGDTRKYFVVEIRQSGAVGDASVSRISNGDLKGLVVRLNGQSYHAYRNLGNAQLSVDLSTSVTAGNIHKLYFSRTDNEPQTPQTFTVTTGLPANLTLPANEQIFLVSGNQGEPLSNGLLNVNTLLNAMETEPGAQLLASTNGVIPCSTSLVTLAVSTSATTGPLTYAFVGPGNSTSGIISTSGSSATVNAAGVYSVTVTNTSTGLSSRASLTVTQPAPITATLSTATLTCSVTSVTLSASATGGSGAGYTYQTSAGESTTLGSFSVTAEGIFSLTVTDANGCTALTSSTVTSNTASPAISAFGTSATLTCSVPSVTLSTSATGATSYTVLGPDSFQPSNITGSFTLNAPGTYTLITSNTATGCTSQTTTTVSSDTSVPVASLAVSGTISCAQPLVTLTASGGDIYLMSGPGIVNTSGASATVDVGGVYSVTVTNNASGCTSTTALTVSADTNPPSLSVTPSSGTLTCGVRSLTLTATGLASSYVWTGGSVGDKLPVTTHGTYSVTATGANGCSQTATTTVNSQTALPTATLTASDNGTLTCTLIQLVLTASGGNHYAFVGPGILAQNTTTGSATVNAPGNYTVVVADVGTGCSSATTITIGQNNTGSLNLSLQASTTALSCSSPTAQLVATPNAGSYRFRGAGLTQDGPVNTATVSQTGVYIVTATIGSCSATASVTIGSGPGTPPNALLLGTGNLSCDTPTLSLTAIGGSRFSFSGPGVVSQFEGRERILVGDYILFRTAIPAQGTAVVNKPGLYTVVVSNENGCTSTASILVTGEACPNPSR